jgi:hypothetical protein
VKKPVNFGFLDFSTLAKRRAVCEREVDAQSRLARALSRRRADRPSAGSGLAIGGRERPSICGADAPLGRARFSRPDAGARRGGSAGDRPRRDGARAFLQGAASDRGH